MATKLENNKEDYERIVVKVKKGNKQIFQSAADEAGESLNTYINNAIELRIEHDKLFVYGEVDINL